MAATGAQDAAAVGGGHTGAEAVLVHTLATGRLKCSLHNILVFIFRVFGTAKVIIPTENTKFIFQYVSPVSHHSRNPAARRIRARCGRSRGGGDTCP